jgi:hypothetical protein
MADIKKIEWESGKHESAFRTILDNDNYINNIVAYLKNGAELWEVENDTFFTCKIKITATNERILYILDMCGKYTDYLGEISIFLDALAKVYGCEKVALKTSKKSHKRAYEKFNFKVEHYYMERVV